MKTPCNGKAVFFLNVCVHVAMLVVWEVYKSMKLKELVPLLSTLGGEVSF